MDKETFTLKVMESEETLYRISISMLKNEKDCEDAVQETILTAYSKLKSLKNEEHFRTWLIRILINKCNRMLNNRKRSIITGDFNEENADTIDVNVNMEIKLALENLEPKIRIVMVMYYVEDFSITEIHRVLKIPEGTVKSRLSKGRQLMRLELK